MDGTEFDIFKGASERKFTCDNCQEKFPDKLISVYQVIEEKNGNKLTCNVKYCNNKECEDEVRELNTVNEVFLFKEVRALREKNKEYRGKIVKFCLSVIFLYLCTAIYIYK